MLRGNKNYLNEKKKKKRAGKKLKISDYNL